VIVEYLRYVVEADRGADFLMAYAKAAEVLQRDPHCLSYEISQGHEELDRFVVRIEWDSLSGHLEGFRKSPAFGEFFAFVRPYLSDIDQMHHYEVHTTSPGLPEKGLPSLYDWCGGEAAVGGLINAFYDRVEADDLIGPLFPGGVSTAHREHVTLWWCEVLGGPAAYTELGGYGRMVRHHLDLNISKDQRRRFVTLMSLAADDAGLPEDPEFRAAFLGYVEWGTRLAFQNSQPGADVVRSAPVPHWGWGVAPPWLG
jgi:hemoglobin